MGVLRPPAALRQPEFRLLFGGQAVSLLGDAIVPVALAFAVLDLTGSVSDLGYVLAARTIPLVGFLLAGGVFADRLPRRSVMIAADLTRLCTQGTLAALLILGQAQLWQLLVLLALHGTATAFFNPAVTGLVPATVTANALQQANALRGMAMSAAAVAGPAIAGILVATVGSGWALAADAASFAVSAALLGLLRLPLQNPLPRQSFLRDLRGGWSELRSRSWIWVIILCSSVGNAVLGAFFVLGPAVSKHSLGGVGAWALIVAILGLGSLLGSAAAMRLHPHRPLLLGSLLVLPFGALPAMLALRLPAPAIAAVALIAGFGNMIFNALWETALQRHVPPAALSRVSAYDWFGSLAAQPIAYASVGAVASTIGTNATLYGAAVLTTIATLAMIAVPSVRLLGRHASQAASMGGPASDANASLTPE